MAAVSMAAENKPAGDWPPFDYRLAEASVRVQLLPAHGLPRQTVSLDGAGRGSFERDGRTLQFPFPESDFLGVVNDLYKIRFFDLTEQLRPPRSVFLKNDGSVGTQASKMHDALTTSVCFSLPPFTKCVSYEADPPLELDRLVQRLLAEGRQRTAPVTGTVPAAPTK